MMKSLDNPIASADTRSALGNRHSALRRALVPALILVLASVASAETPASSGAGSPAPNAVEKPAQSPATSGVEGPVSSGVEKPASSQVERLTLEDAIRLALASNRSIKVESYTRATARAGVLSAYGAFDPALNISRTHSETYSPTLATADTGFLPPSTLIETDNYALSLGGILPWGLQYSIGGTSQNQRGTFNNFINSFQTFGGVQVTQPLLRGFGFAGSSATLGLRVAKADRAIADAQYRQTVIDTVTNVVIAYSNLDAAHANLRTAERSRDLAAQLLKENEKRFQVGSMSESDVTSARARMAAREQAIIFAEEAVRQYDNQLRQLMGEDTFSSNGPLLELVPPPQPDIKVSPADDLKKAYDLRPDLQQARYTLRKTRYNESYERNQLLPAVNFVGDYGYAGIGTSLAASRQMVTNRDNRYYSAGVEISLPITFAQSRGKARAARFQRQQAQEQLEQVKENIALGIMNAANQYESAEKAVTAARTARQLNEALLQAELKRLRAGSGSTFNVLYQQDQLIGVENNYYQALADQRNAAALYERAIGTTLQDYHITLSEQ